MHPIHRTIVQLYSSDFKNIIQRCSWFCILAMIISATELVLSLAFSFYTHQVGSVVGMCFCLFVKFTSIVGHVDIELVVLLVCLLYSIFPVDEGSWSCCLFIN